MGWENKRFNWAWNKTGMNEGWIKNKWQMKYIEKDGLRMDKELMKDENDGLRMNKKWIKNEWRM